MAASAHVREATEATFAAAVLERSQEVVVLVDFWAEWCGPCRVLGPIIEREVAALGGRVELVKVNTDLSPNLAMDYQIRSIPAVKAFRDGQVVDEFVGALPVPQIREFLARLVPSESVRGLSSALGHLAAGRTAEAMTELETLAADPEVGGDAGFHLAHLLLGQRGTDANAVARAHALADKVPLASELQPRVEALKSLADLIAQGAANAGAIAELEAKVAANPKDHESRFGLATARLASGEIRAGLEALLESVSRDARWNDAAARKAMVAVFNHMEEPGQDADLAFEFRRKLQVVL